MIRLLIAWSITFVLESFVLWIFVRRQPFKILLYSFLVNAFTVPLANYIYQNVLQSFLTIEILVWVVESVFWVALLEIKIKQALFLSFAANAVTAVVGWWIFM
jgi:hypothetical protein